MYTGSGERGDRPLLTIAVPTYNRARFLRELLSSVAAQVREEPTVELIISDNASTDETANLVADEQRIGTRIEHIRNASNIGPDANFLQCYERARGKYVWIMGDDDVVAPNALRMIVDQLKDRDFDIVYLTPFGFEGAYDESKRSLKVVPRPRVFERADSFVRRVHFFFAMISANIVNKGRVEEIGHEPFSKLVGSNLVHLGWTFTALRGHRKSLLLDGGLFGYRVANTGGFGVCKVFGPTLSEIAEEWLRVPKLNRIISNGSLQRAMPPHLSMVKQQKAGSFLQEDAHAILSKAFGNNPRYWIFNYPLIVLPKWPAWVWLQMLRVVNRIDRALGFPLLGL